MHTITLVDYESTSAAGKDKAGLRESIHGYRSGLRHNDGRFGNIDTFVGEVDGLDDIDLGAWQSRNNALATLGLGQGDILPRLEALKQRLSASRIGIVMGSSTASVDRLEDAYAHLVDDVLAPAYLQADVLNPHSLGLFVAHRTGITGPAITITTACSSSAKVFATASRWLQSGMVDAVLVGGVDTLCKNVMYGFSSLQLLSTQPCKPLDEARDGINLGEAAGFAILMRAADAGSETSGVSLVGHGESSDAWHMSHPHPDGLGAQLAIEQALGRAELDASAIDYVNLHGTSSRANDRIEGQVIGRLFPRTTDCSSTKAWTGHTLGAAGITEALIAVDAAVTGVVPGSLNLETLDKDLHLSVQPDNKHRAMRHVMSNSFGFGGNNCCLIFRLDAGSMRA